MPHVQKHLRDYYTAKFRDCEKNSYLLKYFNSKILREDAVLLSMKFSELVGKEIVQLYDS